MRAELGQPLTVENKAGAGGSLAPVPSPAPSCWVQLHIGWQGHRQSDTQRRGFRSWGDGCHLNDFNRRELIMLFGGAAAV